MALYDWKLVSAAVRSADRAIKRRGRMMVYSDQQVVKMLFWSVRHDRPCQNSDPGRRQLMVLWARQGDAMERLMHERKRIERAFANMGNAGDGFKGLPPWVRGLEKVRRWVTVKIIFYHARLTARREKT